MTRWKRGPTQPLILMHAHHQWSHWNDAKLEACSRLNVVVGSRVYLNCSGDGSWDREYYIPESADIDQINRVATQIHESRIGGQNG